MTILDKIISYKKTEVNARKEAFPLDSLQRSSHFSRNTVSLSRSLSGSDVGIIAEHKRRSPSKSVINNSAALKMVIEGYEKGGAKGISVLTDTPFFGGGLDDLLLARRCTELPLLRKEFIIDPYQIYEAKACGADAILLIAAALDDKQLSKLAGVASSLGLEVLLEVHNREELDRAINQRVQLIGVNNRNLKTFEVSLETSISLADRIPDHFVKVSESGIGSVQDVQRLAASGYRGFLMGEHFMKCENPGSELEQFIKSFHE